MVLQTVFSAKTICVCFSFWRFTKAQIMMVARIEKLNENDRWVRGAG